MKKTQKAVQEVFRFKGIIERFSGKGGWHFVRFPFSVPDHFDTKGPVRMTGTMNGIPVDRALMPDGDHGHFIVLNNDLRRQAGVRLGYEVSFELQKNASPEAVILPKEMDAVFEAEPDAKTIFNKFRPGVRRSLMTYISAAKRAETREQRAILMAGRLLSGYYDKYIRE